MIVSITDILNLRRAKPGRLIYWVIARVEQIEALKDRGTLLRSLEGGCSRDVGPAFTDSSAFRGGRQDVTLRLRVRRVSASRRRSASSASPKPSASVFQRKRTIRGRFRSH
jgi:hypothetical protein